MIWMRKKTKRRNNLLYRLRKKGVRVSTRERTIFIRHDGCPSEFIQIRHLCREYHFYVQLELQ